MAKKTPVVKIRRPAVKKAASKPAAALKPRLEVSIDYPREGESVRPGHYTVRLTSAGAGQVQARVDGGEWSDCREAVGHHWFDWSPVPGPARVEARARAGKGRWTAAPVRSCSVAG